MKFVNTALSTGVKYTTYPLSRTLNMKKVEIFTDGGCKGNPGPGGYGCILKQNDRIKEIKGGDLQTTNNIMEMTAAIVALKQLQEPCEVRLTTDSQYVVKGMTEWMKGNKKITVDKYMQYFFLKKFKSNLLRRSTVFFIKK